MKTSFMAHFTVFSKFFGNLLFNLEKLLKLEKNDIVKITSNSNFQSSEKLDITFERSLLPKNFCSQTKRGKKKHTNLNPIHSLFNLESKKTKYFLIEIKLFYDNSNTRSKRTNATIYF